MYLGDGAASSKQPGWIEARRVGEPRFADHGEMRAPFARGVRQPFEIVTAVACLRRTSGHARKNGASER